MICIKKQLNLCTLDLSPAPCFLALANNVLIAIRIFGFDISGDKGILPCPGQGQTETSSSRDQDPASLHLPYLLLININIS